MHHLPLGYRENVVISRMYKKLHKAEIVTSSESLPTKDSFFVCVPERGIMLTTDVYDIQPKKRKNSCAYSGVFSEVMLDEMMIPIILGSLLNIVSNYT
jgi:hypothetical protein